MLRKFTLCPSTVSNCFTQQISKKATATSSVFSMTKNSSNNFITLSSSKKFLLFANTQILLAPKTTKTKVGFQEEDVPSESLKNPVWDKEGAEGMFDGELGEDECMLMSESEWEFFESLQLLSEEELDLLEKDTKAAKTKKK